MSEDLKALAEAAYSGPWEVVVKEHPHYLRTSPHREYMIVTAWDHPQLKGPMAVAAVAMGVGSAKGDPWVPLSGLTPENAAYIAAASPDRILALIAEVKTLRARALAELAAAEAERNEANRLMAVYAAAGSSSRRDVEAAEAQVEALKGLLKIVNEATETVGAGAVILQITTADRNAIRAALKDGGEHD